MDHTNQRRRRRYSMLVLSMLVSLLVRPASGYDVEALYSNPWYNTNNPSGDLTNYVAHSTAIYGGHVAGNTTNISPSNSTFTLVSSSFGQAVPLKQPDAYVGSILLPTAVGWSHAVGTVDAGDSGRAFVDSYGRVIALYQGAVTVHWVLGGVTNDDTYFISGAPARRPVRLFWTQHPHDGPSVDLSKVFVKIHYTEQVKCATNTSSTNRTAGLWEDEAHRLRATDCSGVVLVEFFDIGNTNTQKQIGYELLEVLAPQVLTHAVDIGSRLLPVDSFYGNEGLIAQVNKGMPDAAFMYANQNSPMNGWVFAVAQTVTTPWNLEIYWKHKGIQDVEWPYELGWYAADWPADAQLFVRGDGTNCGPAVMIPSDLNPVLQSFQKPSGHASLGPQRDFFTTGEGHALLRYQTLDGVWFEAIHSVNHNDTNRFDLTASRWSIGEELLPFDRSGQSANFDGVDDSILLPTMDLATNEASMSLWFKLDRLPSQLAPGSYAGIVDSADDGMVLFARQANAHMVFRVTDTNTNGITVEIPESVLTTGSWHHIVGVYEGPQKRVTVYLDGRHYATVTNPAAGANIRADWHPAIGRDGINASFYYSGAVDELCIWKRALTAEEAAEHYTTHRGGEPGLYAYYTFDGVVGSNLVDHAGTNAGAIIGHPLFCDEIDVNSAELAHWADYPGYIYRPEGVGYNVDLYDYPDTSDPSSESHVFAVNTNRLEVWWANPTRHAAALPATVYWPSRVERYDNVWPLHAPQLVIAGQGSNETGKLPPDFYGEPSVYVQNNPAADGFNPNEEHALILGDQVYALRDDLNTEGLSDPFVLVDYTHGGRPYMKVFSVVATNASNSFHYGPFPAGREILAPMPLKELPKCSQTRTESPDAVWTDKNLVMWAAAAGSDGTSNTNVLMRYWYPKQSGFYFPGRTNELTDGTPLPWLAGGSDTSKPPVLVTYQIQWPSNAPTMDLCETLVKAKFGLPAIDGQKSVDIVYQQSLKQYGRESVVLMDPTWSRGALMTNAPSSIGPKAELDTDGKYYFPDLPPHLRKRLYFDPNATNAQLRFKGDYVPATAGEPYLLLNVIGGSATDTNSDRYAALHLPGAGQDWSNAVMNLATNVVEIRTNTTPFDSLALSAGIGGGVGYVTLAFNNSTNLASPSDPISMSIIRVVTNLYVGEIKTIESDNPLDERVTLRHSGDFAGREDTYEFEWRYEPPTNEGTEPSGSYSNWIFDSKSTGKLYNTIQGPGVKTLSDNYYVMRYRSTSTNFPVGTNTWSEWTKPVLVMGWIKRALNGINPFEQRITDFKYHGANTLVSMIGQAGRRWEGDIPLNLDSVNDHGLIEIYETILRRGRGLSIDGIPSINYGPANDALLLAAGRVSDLYMLLGNEAYADAKDPTIGFGTDDGTYGAEAGSLFCFMNQEASLLEEELALLRGRDNRYGTNSVRVPPYYNRLIWNFTKDITGGEVAYALNYNIRDQADNIDGFIDENDAAALYPQGHGDAWGHYLTALKGYYGLLASSNFTWIPAVEGQSVAGQTVMVSYFHERKFAAAAAALARTGGEIVNRLHLAGYSESRHELWAGLQDSNTNRAWGVEEWACRAGQGALFNWVVGNSLLPYQDPDPSHEGIQKTDRTTVPELTEVAGCFQRIQTEEDNVNEGLNPVGLARGVVPFDIDPALMDRSNPNAKTHFEQIYDRALVALNNALSVFNHAQATTQLLRRQVDSVHDFQVTAAEQEVDFQNRMIEIFGYPYSDDIGPGKIYPAGYNGPDLIHFRYVDLYDLMGVVPATMSSVTYQCTNLLYRGDDGFVSGADYWLSLVKTVPLIGDIWEMVDVLGTMGEFGIGSLVETNVTAVTYHFDQATGFMVKPPEYEGTRRAQGELQLAYSDFVQAYYRLLQARDAYKVLLIDIDYQYDLLKNQVDLNKLETARMTYEVGARLVTVGFITYLNAAIKTSEATISLAEAFGEAAETTSKVSPFDPTAPLQATFRAATGVAIFGMTAGEIFAEGMKFFLEKGLEHVSDVKLELDLKGIEHREEKVKLIGELEATLLKQFRAQMEIQLQLEALSQSAERYKKVLAEGQRLMDSRGTARKRAAEHIQTARYQDMAYRIFRNDALQKYDQAFDLAARYVYLAAKAYDYETCLLGGDATGTPGSEFLEEVVRTRSLGNVVNGQPQLAGNFGDGGLADVLARMNANWGVLKGRLGFNNPDTETSRFSLRTEAFRTLSVTNSDATWQNFLWSCKVDNLYDVPEFAKNCIPFDDMADAEPGLVIPFSSVVQFGKNFFGKDLAGGDSAYDPTHFATKIRSVGIWFANYNNVAISGLSNTPRVYLVPVGDDLMRSPSDNGGEPRIWQVVDQALPVPFTISEGDLQAYDWIPMHDSLAGSLAQIRQHPALRAYHDSGTFKESECQSSARLIGRSVWNTKWLLIIPAGTLQADRTNALSTFIDGPHGNDGVKDIKLFFQTYSYSGN